MSQKYTLNKQDMKKWGMNTLLFATPTLLAFLTALQNGGSMEFALGAAYSALLSSAIDLTKKFVS